MCRYLLLAPPKPTDHTHPVRMGIGNGLRADIWSNFIGRFGIRHIIEFYGSTEGTAGLINISNKVGAVGFIPLMIRRHIPHYIIKIDQETGLTLRNEYGYCMETGPGEVGKLISKINNNKSKDEYGGYTDSSESEKKILHNVFERGDSFYDSGDLLLRDEEWFVYFMDRSGDTFRWKGENVSTSEVESILLRNELLSSKVSHVIVYGVKVPHNEGRAGMAALLLSSDSDQLDTKELAPILTTQLPVYAVPLFIRVLRTDPLITSTFKYQKRKYSNEGYDLNIVTDPLYILVNREYVPLTGDIELSLNQGTLRI